MPKFQLARNDESPRQYFEASHRAVLPSTLVKHSYALPPASPKYSTVTAGFCTSLYEELCIGQAAICVAFRADGRSTNLTSTLGLTAACLTVTLASRCVSAMARPRTRLTKDDGIQSLPCPSPDGCSLAQGNACSLTAGSTW